MTIDWAPGADGLALAQRARLLRITRQFFFRRDVMEVTVPVLGGTGVTDLHIENVAVQRDGKNHFLQTSPEYFMKRLLATGCGPVYCIGPAFREHESGSRHNTEFTLLEWYRPGFELADLIEELQALLAELFTQFDCGALPFRESRYKDLFAERWGVNPHQADLATLRRIAQPLRATHIDDRGDAAARNDYLDLLFSQGVEAALIDPVVVREYPATQAALACIGEDVDGDQVSFRFECLWQGVELANGYLELRDADELYRRMSDNRDMRRARGLPEIEPDLKLLAALPNLPPCSGVAMGVDRLLMLLMGRKNLDAVLAFSDRRL